MGPKNQNRKLFIPFDSSRRASHSSVFVYQNWMKNCHVMTMPKWRWLFMAILATFFDNF